MNKKKTFKPKIEIPDGEGFNALPIAFNIPRAERNAVQPKRRCKDASTSERRTRASAQREDFERQI
jgi:hypothetical protein